MHVVHDSSKVTAEEEAHGSDSETPWALTVTLDEAMKAQWPPKRLQRQQLT